RASMISSGEGGILRALSSQFPIGRVVRAGLSPPLLLDEEIVDEYPVEARTEEHRQHVLNGIRDRLSHDVKTGVQHERHTGERVEFSYQEPVTLVPFPLHSLQTPCPVPMDDARNALADVLTKS